MALFILKCRRSSGSLNIRLSGTYFRNIAIILRVIFGAVFFQSMNMG